MTSRTPKIKNWSYFLSAPETPPQQLVLLLHGCGGNAEDILPFAPMLQSQMGDASFVVVAPDGFQPSVEKQDGYQWFDIENNYHPALFEKKPDELSLKEREAFDRMVKGKNGLWQASETLNGFLDFCQDKFRVPDQRTVVFGYSQGGMAALDMGFSRHSPVQKVISVSGCYIPPFPDIFQERCQSRPDTTLIHGTKDKVINFNAAKGTEVLLRENGANLRLIRQNGMSHGRGREAQLFWQRAAFETAREIRLDPPDVSRMIRMIKGREK